MRRVHVCAGGSVGGSYAYRAADVRPQPRDSACISVPSLDLCLDLMSAPSHAGLARSSPSSKYSGCGARGHTVVLRPFSSRRQLVLTRHAKRRVVQRTACKDVLAAIGVHERRACPARPPGAQRILLRRLAGCYSLEELEDVLPPSAAGMVLQHLQWDGGDVVPGQVEDVDPLSGVALRGPGAGVDLWQLLGFWFRFGRRAADNGRH